MLSRSFTSSSSGMVWPYMTTPTRLDMRRALMRACSKSKPLSWVVATGACRPERRMLAVEPALTKASTRPRSRRSRGGGGERVAERAVDLLDLGAAGVCRHHRHREPADLPVAQEAQARQLAAAHGSRKKVGGGAVAGHVALKHGGVSWVSQCNVG